MTATSQTRSAHLPGGGDLDTIAAHFIDAFQGTDPAAIIFFCAYALDGAALSARLKDAFPRARVAGCTTAGEWTDQGRRSRDGVAAIALGHDVVERCAVELVELDPAPGAVETRIAAGTRALGQALEVDLRELDPEQWIGILLCDSSARLEERVNAALGDAAPFLSFVGGSAADDAGFAASRVFVDGRESTRGAALMLVHSRVPFVVLKACHFAPTDQQFVATRSDEAARVIYELDGKPAPETYAEAIGTTVDALDFDTFFANPIGLLIHGEPWLRSPVSVTDDGGIFFAAATPEGATVHLMKGGDIVEDTRTALAEARERLGVEPGAGLFFNCVHRRAEVDQLDVEADYHDVLDGFPLAGFHTQGESWLGHLNQTLTAILFGKPA